MVRPATLRTLNALASDKRLRVLHWLKEPERHFPPQVDGDRVRDGVCSVSLAAKLGISQPTTSRHMKVLADAGLVRATRIRGWTFYRRNEQAIDRAKQLLAETL